MVIKLLTDDVTDDSVASYIIKRIKNFLVECYDDESCTTTEPMYISFNNRVKYPCSIHPTASSPEMANYLSNNKFGIDMMKNNILGIYTIGDVEVYVTYFCNMRLPECFSATTIELRAGDVSNKHLLNRGMR